MAKPLKLLPIIFIIIVTVAVLGLSGCSTGTSTQTSTPEVQQPSSSSTPPSSGNGQGNTSSGQRGSRGLGGQNMAQVLNRAADILGISESTFTSAFNDAQKSVFPNRPSGDNMTRGQRPPGSDNSSGQGSRPPSSGSGGPSSQGQSSMMTKVYAQMATALNISADKISTAMQQAFTELRGQTGTVQ